MSSLKSVIDSTAGAVTFAVFLGGKRLYLIKTKKEK
jgi:hypothetical protein